jgi:hypothetical protein
VVFQKRITVCFAIKARRQVRRLFVHLGDVPKKESQDPSEEQSVMVNCEGGGRTGSLRADLLARFMSTPGETWRPRYIYIFRHPYILAVYIG